MKKRISIILVIVMIVFALGTTLTLAQEDIEENQEEVLAETDETVSKEFVDTEEDSEQEDIDSENETEASYDNIDELLAAVEDNEEFNNIEKIILERKLTSYQKSLSIATMTSVVNKIVDQEIALGQGFVILNNLDQSVNNKVDEERALALINSYQNEDGGAQFSFQTALELRKLSREDLSGEKSEAFIKEIESIIEDNGEIEISELKQLAASYRKEAREEAKIERKNNSKKKLNSVSDANLENRKEKNISKNANNGKGNSNKPKSKANGKSSNNSPNSNANNNAKK